MTDFSYVGSGKVYMREAGVAEAMVHIGNVSQLNLSIEEESIDLKDHTKPGGGIYNQVKRIASMNAAMTLHDLSASNLAKAMFGATGVVTAGAVTDEAITPYKGGLTKFANPPASSPAIVVTSVNGDAAETRANTTAYDLGDFIKPAIANTFFYKVTTAGTTAGAPPTFPTTVGATVTDGTAVLTCWGVIVPVAGTDYVQAHAGLTVPDAARVTDGDPWLVDYTKQAGNAVQMLVNSGKTWELVFEGLNEARDDKPLIVELYRVGFGPSQSLALIGDEYAGLELTGAVQADQTKTGSGISQYGKVTVVT